MTIRIANDSASVVARGYAVDHQGQVIWLELAPQHPKSLGAIWADLVQSQRPFLRLRDDEAEPTSRTVRGLGRRYHRLVADAPTMANMNRSRPKLLRLIAPEACQSTNPDKMTFYVVDWPGVQAATALAVAVERATATPILIGWGDYLLAVALEREYASPLVTGGKAPQGYRIDPAPWDELVAEGVKAGHITLAGTTVRIPSGVKSDQFQPVEVEDEFLL